jgi:hypothetical protein
MNTLFRLLAATFALLAMFGAVTIAVPPFNEHWLSFLTIGIVGFAVCRLLAWAFSKS